MSSVTNVLVVFAAARGGDRFAFGAFSLVFGLGILGLGLRTATLGDVVLVDSSGVRDTAQLAAGASAYLGLAVGLAGGGLAVTLGLGPVFACACLGWPLVFLQDSMRSYAFASRRPQQALALDGTWLLVQLLALTVGGKGATWAFTGWLGGAAIAAGTGMRTLPPMLRGSSVKKFLISRRHLLAPYALQFSVTTGTTQLLSFLIAGVGQVRDVGALRGAQTIMGPFNILISADRIDLVTRLRAGSDTARLSRRLLGSAILLTGSAALIVIACGAAPTSLGRKFLGASWPAASEILPAVALQFWLIGLAQSFQVRLTAALRPNESLRVKAIASTVSVTLFAVAEFATDFSALSNALGALITGSTVNLLLTALAARRYAPIALFGPHAEGSSV